MKRIGFLHEKVCKITNIDLADKNASKNKGTRLEVLQHKANKEKDNLDLQKILQDKTYKTSKYTLFKIYEPKERIIYKLPYYPDRITHHAIMNVMEPIWLKIFIDLTYSCIKNRGIHKLANDLNKVLKKYPEDTQYCLKLDIHKFYPSLDHEVLLNIIKKKIKDPNLLLILSEIINSADGVPIGNYLSQFFANLYLAYFDHWVKEELKCKFYFRYADDIVILNNDKKYLRSVLLAIKLYMSQVLKLELKPNYLIFPVKTRGIDFVGYKFYHTHVLLRKSIKKRLKKLITKYKCGFISRDTLEQKMQAYFGWMKYCNSKNLLRKILNQTGLRFSNWKGSELSILRIYDLNIKIINLLFYKKYFLVQYIYKGKPYYFNSRNRYLFYLLIRYKLPINFKILSNAKCCKANRKA